MPLYLEGRYIYYSKDFPFIWDQLNLPIRYGSDINLAKEIILGIAKEQLSNYVEESKSKWQDVVNRYYIEDALVEPSLAITMNDNWIQFNLRYIVDYKKRRSTKHKLNELIWVQIQKSNSEVMLASSTVEIVKIPEINISENTKREV